MIPNLCLADNRDHLLQTIANAVKGAKARLLPSQNPNRMFDTMSYITSHLIVLNERSHSQDITGKDDLPSPQLFFAEFHRWKIKVQAGIITADSCAVSLKACDPDDFPKLYILLNIAATLPILLTI